VSALGPRLVVAGTSSGVGKTTVATGLMAALRQRGVRVAAAKVGPDFIDPGYHALATGRPPRNLDAWICGPDTIAPLAARAGEGAEVLVIEGVMGLFDGPSSTAEVAGLLDAPVVLVVDAAAMSGSVAALVHGFATFDPTVRVAGVILNRVGSDGHEALLREALDPLGLPVLGALRRDDALVWRDRHLGLVPVVEQREAVERSLARLAQSVARSVDLEAVVDVARSAPRVAALPDPPRARPVAPRPVRIAVAAGPAFSFMYPDNLELLEQAGAEVVPFDPLADPVLPEPVDGLVAGGGFPEVFAQALSDNQKLLAALRDRVLARQASSATSPGGGGLAVWAECGGLLWLARSLDGRPLAGVIEADARMTDRLTLGYRTAMATRDSPVAAAGSVVRGHEFHYSAIEPEGDGLVLEGRFGQGRAGWLGPRLFASYVHLHLGAAPEVAERFVAACAAGG
jgi:cobyrinic acid a,c-diamide synthase